MDSLGRGTPQAGLVHVGPWVLDPGAWVYGTVTLMSVLVVFDGWADLRGPMALVLVVLGPTVALALARLFADVLQEQIEHGRALSASQWRHLVAHSLQYLFLALPPLAVFAVTAVVGEDLRQSIQWMLWTGVASLGGWSSMAAHRVGMRGWRVLAAFAFGILLGLAVMLLQVLLKPH